MSSVPPKHHMTVLTLIPTHQRGRANFEKLTTQADGVAYPTTLYFSLEHKEANTRLIVFHLAAIQIRKMKTELQYVHTEVENVLPRMEEGGKQGWREGEHF